MSLNRPLQTRMVEKPWGRDVLPPPFAPPAGQRIGEIWFKPAPEMPDLLVKYLFTSEKLSVQVHPDDAQAPSGARGKDECWLVVAAEPGARLAAGFTTSVTADQMRAAALDGTIEDLLDWRVVSAGAFIYLAAGTVHAIGAGLTLIEVQQNSDLTYRLYDYGRPRALHLDEAVRVATSAGPLRSAKCRLTLPRTGNLRLASGPPFQLDRLCGAPDAEICARYGDRPVLVVPLEGAVRLGVNQLEVGQCGLAASLYELALGEGASALVAQPS